MSPISLVDAKVTLNSVVISTSTKKATLQLDAIELDTTAFGGGGWKSGIGGLKNGTVALDLINDYSAGALDATTYALFGTVVSLAVRTTSGAISTSNPEYAGSVLVNQWKPIDNAVGDLSGGSIQWPLTGTWLRNIT
jgi:hypothetical protein